jgi:hypothetical protein
MNLTPNKCYKVDARSGKVYIYLSRYTQMLLKYCNYRNNTQQDAVITEMI